MTCNLLVFVQCQWDQRNEADGEEGPSSYATSRPVAAVPTLGCYILGAFEVVGKFLRAKCDTEGHLV